MALKSSISSAAGVHPKQRSQLIISSRSSHALSLNSVRPGSRSLTSPRAHQGPQQQQERGHLHLQLAAVKGDAEVQTETVDVQTQQSAPATEAWVWEDSTDGAAAYAAFFLWLALGSWPALQSFNIAGRQAVQYIYDVAVGNYLLTVWKQAAGEAPRFQSSCQAAQLDTSRAV